MVGRAVVEDDAVRAAHHQGAPGGAVGQAVREVLGEGAAGGRMLAAQADLQEGAAVGLPAGLGVLVEDGTGINAEADQGEVVAEHVVAGADTAVVADQALGKQGAAGDALAAAALDQEALAETVGRFDFQFFELAAQQRHQAAQAHGAVHGDRLEAAAGHDQAAHELGQADHFLGVGAAFLVVTVEQGRGGLAVDHPSHLPAQVGHVPQAGHQALADKERRDVGRVAGEKHPALLEGGAAAGVEAVYRLALHHQVLRGDPGGQQFGDFFRALHVLMGFAGLEHEFPALSLIHI